MSHADSTTLADNAQLALLARIEQALEARRARIDDDVKNYPRPITGCDVQFEYALEQQAGVRKELQRAAALRDAVEHVQFAQAVTEFLSDSAFIEAAVAREITASLAALAQEQAAE